MRKRVSEEREGVGVLGEGASEGCGWKVCVAYRLISRLPHDHMLVCVLISPL